MALFLQPFQHFLQQNEFSGIFDQSIAFVGAVGAFWRLQTGFGEQIGVVRALLQLHDDVQQGHLGSAVLHTQSLEILGQNVAIVFSEIDLIFLKLVHTTHFCIGLSSTRTISSLFEGMPTSTSDFRRRNMCGPRRVCRRWIWSSLEISANSRVKSSKSLKAKNSKLVQNSQKFELALLKSVRTEEVQQMEQFLQIVLQWSAGEQKPIANVELAEGPEEQRLVVLESVRLVHD